MVAARAPAGMLAPARAILAVSAICFSCAISSTLSVADPWGRRRSRRATVQLNLAFLDASDPPAGPLPPPLVAMPWERFDAAARAAALEILARLIARMLAAAADEASHE